MQLDIPFRSLGSQPVVVSIDRIYLIAGDKADFKVLLLFLRSLALIHSSRSVVLFFVGGQVEEKDPETLAQEMTKKLEALKQHELATFGGAKQVSARSSWLSSRRFPC